MTPEEERLRQFGAIIGRLILRQDISRAEARECWRQICAEEQPKLQQGAFMAALKAKPETLEEIAGTFEALYEHDTVKVDIDTPEPIIDNSGTGADTLKPSISAPAPRSSPPPAASTSRATVPAR
jgi:anthranilate phosphoribosyltransferase